MSRRPTFIARQSARPRGLLGRLVGRVMRAETAVDNDRALELLAPAPGDRVLEIGFGPGRTIGRLAERVPEGGVAGIDHSDLMLRVATRRNAAAIRGGRVELRVGDSDALPFEDDAFDAILAVHTLYFWDPLAPHLQECRRVSGPTGRLVLAHRPAEDRDAVEDYPREVYRFRSRRELRTRLAEAGFGTIRTRTHASGDRLLEVVEARVTP